MHGKGEDRIFAYVCLGAGNEQCSRLSTERMGVGMESALEIRDRQNCWWLWCHHCCGNSFVVVTLCRGNRCWSFSLKTRQLCFCAAVFFEVWDWEFPWDQRSAKLLVTVSVMSSWLWQQLCAVATSVWALLSRQWQLYYCEEFQILLWVDGCWDGEFSWDQRSAKLLVTVMSSLLWQQLCCGNFVPWQQVLEL